jgi:hypothetical protein
MIELRLIPFSCLVLAATNLTVNNGNAKHTLRLTTHSTEMGEFDS